MIQFDLPKLNIQLLEGFTIEKPIKAPAYEGDVGYDLAVNRPVGGFVETESNQHSIPSLMSTSDKNVWWLMPHSHFDVPVGISGELIIDQSKFENFRLTASINIRPRSSTWKKKRLQVESGTIDLGYRGQWFFALHNPNSYSVKIINGEFLAQAVIEVNISPILEMSSTMKLSESKRGVRGFGSSTK